MDKNIAPITAESAKEVAALAIADKRLHGLRVGKNKVRFFVVSEFGRGPEIDEVTSLIARILGRRRSKEGYIIAPNYGYSPIIGLAEAYAQEMGKDPAKQVYSEL